MQFSFARQRLYHLIRQSPSFNLAEAALYIAQEAYPDLEVEAYLNALDTMAEEVRERLPPENYPLRIVQTINRYLFEDLGFTGNTQDYYDPRNSYLNQVIDRRIGIPITLSLVYLEIARRIEFLMVGVNFPAHFLIRPDREDMALHVDPFNQGEILFEQDCQNRLSKIYGHSVELQPRFFRAVTPQQFLVRMLTNLKHVYLNQHQIHKCLAASERILLVDPEMTHELRDRGILYYQLGRWTEARQDLEEYITHHPQVEDIGLIHQLLNRMGKGV